MIKVTLDTSVIFEALDPQRKYHKQAVQLVDMHKQNRIRLQVSAANMSENVRINDKGIESLERELNQLGIHDVNILPIPFMLGFARLDLAHLADDSTKPLLEAIWRVLFPNTPYNHAEFLQQRQDNISDPDGEVHPRWRNQMNDVLTVFSYIRDSQASAPNDENFLVSADSNDIVKRATQLAALGANNIFNIPEAVRRIDLISKQTTI